MANFVCFWANFNCEKLYNEKIILPSCHTAWMREEERERNVLNECKIKIVYERERVREREREGELDSVFV